jgi:hypothetical protein
VVDWLFTVLRPALERSFHLYGDQSEHIAFLSKGRCVPNDMETSPLPMKGCKISALGLLAGRIFFPTTPAVTQGLSISGLVRRTAPFSRLLRPKRGCGGSILTRILTDPHSVASYDTQGDGEDLFLPGTPRTILGEIMNIHRYANELICIT